MVRLQNYTKEGLLRLDEAQQKNQETAEQVSQIEQAILELSLIHISNAH